MTLLGRLIGRRKPKETLAPAPATTSRAVARQLADSVIDTTEDPGPLATLHAIARLWRTRDEHLSAELLTLDVYAVGIALDHVRMTESMRVRLREELRSAMLEHDVDLDAMTDRHRQYDERLAADREIMLAGGSVRGIAASVGAVFTAALGGENALLADAVGRRFIDHSDALRGYLESAVKLLDRH